MIDIAMISCNRKRITEISITEIQHRTTTPHRLIILDNGSIDGSSKMLCRLSHMGLIDKLILSEENTGVHWGHNLLLDEVKTPLFICTDNDIVPEIPDENGDWLSKLLALWSIYFPEFAALACRPHIFIGDSGNLFQDAPEIKEMSHVGSVLRLMDTEMIRQVGGWEKKKQPSRNNEEWYICAKLKNLGHKVGYSRDIRVIHLFGDEDKREDPWGYPLGVEHGHPARHPPVNHFSWDRIGLDWETCK